MNKTYLFVDGSNFYGSQYDLFGPHKYLNFKKFINILEKDINIFFNKIYFYASYSPKPQNISKKAKLYLKNEAFFYKSVNNVKNLSFFKGYRSKTSGKEKEVDIKLTADLVRFGFENKIMYKGAFYFYTSVIDFIPNNLKLIIHPKQKIKLVKIKKQDVEEIL